LTAHLPAAEPRTATPAGCQGLFVTRHSPDLSRPRRRKDKTPGNVPHAIYATRLRTADEALSSFKSGCVASALLQRAAWYERQCWAAFASCPLKLPANWRSIEANPSSVRTISGGSFTRNEVRSAFNISIVPHRSPDAGQCVSAPNIDPFRHPTLTPAQR
jgi:hypothetical protein